jgi:parvulin-like peptidyl-prolyl isomerase
LQQYFIMQYLASEGDKLKLAERSPLKEELEFQRINVIAGAMLNFQRESYQIPPGAAEDYYKANLSKYEQAKIKVIFVGFKPTVAGSVSTTDDLARAAQAALAQVHSGTDRSEAQAKTLAAEIVAKARAGADFVALVGQYSDDPVSKAAQGDFGTIKHDSTSYPEDLKKAVFALETGQVSDPLRQGTGFYIIRVVDKSPQPFDEVSPDIFQNLRQLSLNDWFTAVNKRFKPEIKEPAAFVQSGASPTVRTPTALPNGAVPSGLPKQ